MAYTPVAQNTLLAVVQNMAGLLSLPRPTDAAGSQDPAVQLMTQCANLAVNDMATAYEWPELTKPGEILVTTALPPTPGQSQELDFDLPDDFWRFIDQTQWNNSMRFPAVGPVSPQGWMTYRVFPISANFTLTWQVREGKIWFLNPPAEPGQLFRFMYYSRGVVNDADAPTNTKNIANKNGDTFVLDPYLVMLYGRLKWLGAKGFDTTEASTDFIGAWDDRISAKKGANILNLAGGRHDYPYIGIGNLPEASLYGMRQF